ncbi:MAG: CHC2 zinc finger domain-containing protein [Terriglobales bacterium]
MLNFDEIKKVRIVEVCGRYGVALRFKGQWANAVCPLPSHKSGDKGRNFTVNVTENYWRCFSESCNQKNGGKKGGDVINFVAVMESCRERDAAQKLADWYGLDGNKKGEHMARPPHEVNQPHEAQPDHNPPSDNGKGYIHALDGWFNELFGLGPELVNDEFWKKCRNAVKSKCIESFRNGKLAATR